MKPHHPYKIPSTNEFNMDKCYMCSHMETNDARGRRSFRTKGRGREISRKIGSRKKDNDEGREEKEEKRMK
jgi:hypothetical protein